MNKIIFLDIDGTLIDERQRPNCDVVLTIERLQQRGFRFGINSNRSWEDVAPIIVQFHLDGPFILENGAYIKETLNSVARPCGDITDSIPEIVFTMMKDLSVFFSADVSRVNTTKYITFDEFSKIGKHFYMNIFRKFSASIHHRFDGIADFGVAKELEAHLNKNFLQKELPLVAIAHEHGASVTVGPIGIDKGTALLFLRTQNPEAYYIAIGDGLGDVAMRPYVDELWAVSNALPELKNVADKIAHTPITQGVKELLEQVDKTAQTI